MKPIEPGCLVWVYGLVRNTQFNGMSLTVERWITRGEFMVTSEGRLALFMDQSCWLCTSPSWPGGEPFSARNLMRIDGGDPDAVLEQHDQEVPA